MRVSSVATALWVVLALTSVVHAQDGGTEATTSHADAGADTVPQQPSETSEASDAPDAGGGLVIEEWSESPEPGLGRAVEQGAEGPDDAGGIDAFEPVADAPVSSGTSDASLRDARVYGWARTLGAVDTSFDSPRGDPLAENVFDLRSRALLGAEVRLTDTWRVVAEARAFWRVTGQRAFDRTKGLFEVEAGEAFVDFYSPKVDVRLGNQVVAFGANPAFAPADQLNPRDLREGALTAQPGDLKLPNFGARATGTTGQVTWTAAWFPFFKPNRYAVIGQDEAMVQPGLGLALPNPPDESIEDELQPHLLETERPRAFPWLGDVGLRATLPVGPVTAGVSWIWVNEKLPRVELDPELAALARSAARGNEPDAAVLASLQDRSLAGEQLVRGSYPRQHVVSAQAQFLVRSAQVDLDVSWSPAQTLYASSLDPIRKSTITWVAGVSQASESKLLYNVTWFGISVPGLPSRGYLFLLEPATAAGAPRTVWFQALFATVGYRMLDDRLELSARGGFEPVQRSFALAPQVSWKGLERVSVSVGAEFYQGRVYSPFGYFDRNDQVFAQVSVDLF